MLGGVDWLALVQTHIRNDMMLITVVTPSTLLLRRWDMYWTVCVHAYM